MSRYKCSECKRCFKIEANFNKHVEKCQSSENFGLTDFKSIVLQKSAFRQFLVVYILQNMYYKDSDGFFIDKQRELSELLFYIYQSIGVFKFQICVNVDFMKPNELETKAYLCSSLKNFLRPQITDELLNECKQEVCNRIDTFTNLGSGWIIDNITSIEIRVAKYIPQVGGCSTNTLPSLINNKKAIISPQCDTDCFMWCILIAFHKPDKNPQRLHQYQKFINKYKFEGVRETTSLDDIKRFEKSNEISVHVYSLDIDDKNLIPLRLSAFNFEKSVKLFYHNNH